MFCVVSFPLNCIQVHFLFAFVVKSSVYISVSLVPFVSSQFIPFIKMYVLQCVLVDVLLQLSVLLSLIT